MMARGSHGGKRVSLSREGIIDGIQDSSRFAEHRIPAISTEDGIEE
jgi:hypothetical protein